jgi:prevent-host-death family protein
MITVGVRELKQRTSDLIRQVRQHGREIQITYRGEVVALIVPVMRPAQTETESAWATLDTLAAEIGAQWQEGVTSVEAVVEGRA